VGSAAAGGPWAPVLGKRGQRNYNICNKTVFVAGALIFTETKPLWRIATARSPTFIWVSVCGGNFLACRLAICRYYTGQKTPDVVAAQNVEVTNLIEKKPAVAIKDESIIQNFHKVFHTCWLKRQSSRHSLM